MKMPTESRKLLFMYTFCKPVKGHARSAIYDLEAQKLHLISNTVYDFITRCEGKSYHEICSLYKDTDKEVIDTLMSSLSDKRLICFVEKDDYHRFIPMPDFPRPESGLNNFIIDIDAESDYDLDDALRKISSFKLQAIQLRFLYAIDYDMLAQIVGNIYTIHTGSIEITIPIQTLERADAPYLLLERYQNITNLYVWGATSAKNESYKQCNIAYTSKTQNNKTLCGCRGKHSFSCNKRLYVEAQKQNTCLAGKCCIDKDGRIKNCPSMPYIYGNIKDITIEELQQIVASDSFTRFFRIKKDEIRVCNVCEFRYACFDCRAFLSEKDDLFSKPEKCCYNPYTACWENK